MDYLSLIALIVGVLALIVAYAQLRRTPKLKAKPEHITPTCLTIMGVSMKHGRDRLGY